MSFAFVDEIAAHVSHERRRTAEPDGSQFQEVPDEIRHVATGVGAHAAGRRRLHSQRRRPRRRRARRRATAAATSCSAVPVESKTKTSSSTESAGNAAGHDRRQLPVNVLLGHRSGLDRVVEIAARRTRRQRIDDHAARGHRAGVDFLLGRIVRADGGDEESRMEIRSRYSSGVRGRRARDTDVALTRSASAQIRRGLHRKRQSIRHPTGKRGGLGGIAIDGECPRRSRTTDIARSCASPCSPQPTMVMVRASGSARCSAASAATAAVRMLVSDDRVHHRQRLTSVALQQDQSALNRRTAAPHGIAGQIDVGLDRDEDPAVVSTAAALAWKLPSGSVRPLETGPRLRAGFVSPQRCGRWRRCSCGCRAGRDDVRRAEDERVVASSARTCRTTAVYASVLRCAAQAAGRRMTQTRRRRSAVPPAPARPSPHARPTVRQPGAGPLRRRAGRTCRPSDPDRERFPPTAGAPDP